MGGEKIMLVDDDAEFLEELQEIIKLSGYDPISVQESKLVFGVARKVKPDVIVLDLKMEGMNGFEVASKLHRFPETSKIPIIAMTGYFTENEHLPLMELCDMKICLKKPFNPLDIIAQIENVLAESEKNTKTEK